MRAGGGRQPGDAEYRVWMTVWTAMALPILIYFALGEWVTPVATAENASLEHILMLFAAAYVIASFPAKRWLLAQAGEVDSTLLRRAALVVPLVLCEAAALTGLALRLVIGSTHYYVFLLLALAGMLVNLPRRGE